MKVEMSVSRLCLTLAPWTIARQAPLSMGAPRQEHWSGLSLPSPGDLPDPGMEPRSPALEPPGKPPRAESLRNLGLREAVLHRGVDTDLQIDHLDQDTDYYLLNKEREKHCFKKYVPSRTVFSKYSNNGRLIHRPLISSCWMNDSFPLSISLKPKSYSCIKKNLPLNINLSFY